MLARRTLGRGTTFNDPFTTLTYYDFSVCTFKPVLYSTNLLLQHFFG